MKTNNNTTRLNCLILLPFLGQKPQKQIEAEIEVNASANSCLLLLLLQTQLYTFVAFNSSR